MHQSVFSCEVDKLLPIVARDTIEGTKPHHTIGVLMNCVDSIIRQSILLVDSEKILPIVSGNPIAF